MIKEEDIKNIKEVVEAGINNIYISYSDELCEMNCRQTDTSENALFREVAILLNEEFNNFFNDGNISPEKYTGLVEKEKIYYTEMTESGSPFSDISKTAYENSPSVGNINIDYSGVKGYYFVYKKNEIMVIAYQDVKKNRSIKKVGFKTLGSQVELVTKDLYTLESRIDFLIYNNHVLYKNPKVLEDKFALDKENLRKANCNISRLSENFSELKNLKVDIKKLPNAYLQKLVMDDKSNSLIKDKQLLLEKVANDSEAFNGIKIENNDFVIETTKDLKSFINLLSDDYLKSNVTNKNYISLKKKTTKNES